MRVLAFVVYSLSSNIILYFTMGLFNDPLKLFNQSFPWALGRYRDGIDNSPNREDAPPPDLDALSVYVDDDGSVNVSEQILLHGTNPNPISAPAPISFTKDDLYIQALKAVLDTFPLYGIMLFPIRNPMRRAGISARQAAGFMEPPEGFVPCGGQTLIYEDGSELQVPNLISVSRRTGAGDGLTTTTEILPPPDTAYIMKVPEGWVETRPGSLPTTLNNYGAERSVLGLFGLGGA